MVTATSIPRLKQRYRAYRQAHDVKPIYYTRRERWTALPAEFTTRRAPAAGRRT